MGRGGACVGGRRRRRPVSRGEVNFGWELGGSPLGRVGDGLVLQDVGAEPSCLVGERAHRARVEHGARTGLLEPLAKLVLARL